MYSNPMKLIHTTILLFKRGVTLSGTYVLETEIIFKHEAR